MQLLYHISLKLCSGIFAYVQPFRILLPGPLGPAAPLLSQRACEVECNYTALKTDADTLSIIISEVGPARRSFLTLVKQASGDGLPLSTPTGPGRATRSTARVTPGDNREVRRNNPTHPQTRNSLHKRDAQGGDSRPSSTRYLQPTALAFQILFF